VNLRILFFLKTALESHPPKEYSSIRNMEAI